MVMDWVAQGLSDREVGLKMGITHRTVKQHMHMIRANLCLSHIRRIQLAAWWNCELFQMGLRHIGIISVLPDPEKITDGGGMTP